MPTLGLIADTHGLLRPEAEVALAGCVRILHAGDIGCPEVLEGLQCIAPVVAVRGNVDRGAWAEALPERLTLDLAGRSIHLLHDLQTLALDPAACGIDVVVAGHSHRPLVEERGGVLYVNPGSAGRRRFRLPVCLARLQVSADGLTVSHLELVG